MKNQLYEKTTTKRRRKSAEERMLSHSVATLASIIDSIATHIRGSIDNGEGCDIKQVKELCTTAKELSALMGSMGDKAKEGEESRSITVLFEGEGEKWAR